MRGNRAALVLGAAALAVVLALVAGVWGLRADRDPDHHADSHGAPAGEGWVDVPGGHLRVREATDRSIDHGKMPGMQMMPDPDPVPDGLRRLSVDVDLAAGDDDLRWSAADFVLDGHGMRASGPHGVQLGDDVVPRDSSVAGTLVFDVPEEVTELSLSFRGSSAVPVEAAGSPTSHGGHESKDHDHQQ